MYSKIVTMCLITTINNTSNDMFYLDFQSNDHWKHVAVQPISITCVSQSHQWCDHERSRAEGMQLDCCI